jgi:ABC-type transport system involved in cytochrome bd biosynthesis fused ATPase/permease subunit
MRVVIVIPNLSRIPVVIGIAVVVVSTAVFVFAGITMAVALVVIVVAVVLLVTVPVVLGERNCGRKRARKNCGGSGSKPGSG